jgi:hypothetical protein
VAFAIALSAPELTDIRRPFHDTVGLFYGRILFTDAMRNGSIPFWYPYTRYSIPMASLEGGMGWSPVGFLVGAIAPYDLFLWAVEGLIWNLICLSGTFMFARRHVTSPYSAAAIAMTYSASGLLVAAVPTIGTTRAFQIGPWVFQAIDTLVGPQAWNRTAWARGTLTLTVAGTLWLSSAYPGIWLTAPVLVAPYALMATRGRLPNLVWLATGATAAAILALGMCAVLVDGTVNVPQYGEVGRRLPVSPGDGALQLRTLIHAFLANPGYLRDASGPLEPLYMGGALIPGLLILTPRWPVPKVSIASFFGNRATRLANKLLAIVWAGSAAVVAFHGLVAGQPQPWIMLWFGFAILILSSQQIKILLYIDYSLIIASLISISIASGTSIGDFFRAHIPPFTFIRWNDWYVWVAVLCIATYVWRNIEMWVTSLRGSTTNKVDTTPSHPMLPRAGVIASGVASLILGITLLPRPVPIDYDVIHTLTLLYISSLIFFGAIVFSVWCVFALFAKAPIKTLPLLWFALLVVVPIASGLGAYMTLPAEDQARRLATYVGISFHQAWDFIQMVAVPLVALTLVRAVNKTLLANEKMAILATVVAVDMSLAAPRVISHTDYLRAGQISTPSPVDRVFAFTGNERSPNDASMGSGNDLYNSFMKVPDQLRPGGFQPQMGRYDVNGGQPSPFAQFIRFPSQWSVPSRGIEGRPERESIADVPGHTWVPPASDTTAYPACDADVSDTPSGIVTKLLPDRVDMTIKSECTRLLVLMDTWTAGWTVSVDGTSAEPIRVNEVLRGVVVGAGTNHITWIYRPVHWKLITIFMGLSALITCCLFLFSIPFRDSSHL